MSIPRTVVLWKLPPDILLCHRATATTTVAATASFGICMNVSCIFSSFSRARITYSLCLFISSLFYTHIHAYIYQGVCCCHNCANVLLVAGAFTVSFAPAKDTLGCCLASRRADWNSRITWNGFFLSAIALVAILVIHKVNTFLFTAERSLRNCVAAIYSGIPLLCAPSSQLPVAKWHFARWMPLELIYIYFFCLFFAFAMEIFIAFTFHLEL